MVWRPLAIALALAGTALALPQPLAAQDLPAVQGPPIESHATFRSAVDLVTLSVTVTDGRQKHVPGLGQTDFQILEDGVPQELSYFAANQLPLDIALLIDTSSSMRNKLEIVQQAADRFLKTLRAGDRAEIVGFNSQTKILQSLTSDVPALEAAVRKTVPRGGTALYTSVYIVLDRFMRAKSAGGEVRRPAIIVLTDGQDTASLIQFDDLLDRARRAGVAIYTISVVAPAEGDGDADANRHFMNDSDFALKTLAKETGGRSFFPLKIADLNDVYASVAGELSTQYALGYVPRTPRDDGSFRRILVRVVSRPDATSRTRTGYYSPRAAASLR